MIDSLLISRGANVRDAMRQLDVAESKTLFVVDEGRTLLGALTDGDIRRWILSGGELHGLVELVCNTSPFSVSEQYDRDLLKREMLARRMYCVPVINPDGKVVDAVLWEQMFGEGESPTPQSVNLPVVIMAGGKGTRLAPFTSVLPKPLIPIGDKTVIELIVNSFTLYGVSDFYLSVNYKSKIIKSYFDELSPSYNVHYIYEQEPLGTAGSLSQLVGKFTTDLIVTNCDVIIRANYDDLVKYHQSQQNDITLVASLKNIHIPYGVCEIESGGQLKKFLEKPEYNFLVNTGLYVLKPDVLGLIPEGQFFHITDLIEKLRGMGRRVGVFPISDKAWVDTGEWAQYRSAVAELATDRRRSPR